MSPNGDIFLLPTRGNRQPQPLVVSDSGNMRPAISPDGRWIAYQSNETGRPEIYVRPFPDVGSAKWPISTQGGLSPVWASNGRELYYNDISQNALMRVVVDSSPTFGAGTPQLLFQRAYFWGPSVTGRPFDIAPDGRFLMIKEGEGAVPSIVVVLN